MLTGGIRFEDPYDIFEARFIVGAKRVCAALAVVALGIGAHDLMNSHSIGSTAAFASVHEGADAPVMPAAKPAIPATVISKEHTVAVVVAPLESGDSASATIPAKEVAKDKEVALAEPVAVAIPGIEKAVIAPARAAQKVVAKADNSAVAELAEARHLDAIEVAMGSEKVMAKATAVDMAMLVAAPPAVTVVPAARIVAAPMPRPKPIKLASLNPTALPAAVQPKPAAVQGSLPVTIAILPRPAPRARLAPKAQTTLQPAAPAVTATVTPASPQVGTVQVASIDPEAFAFGTSQEPPAIQISLPATISVLPPHAPGVPPPSPAQRLHLEGEARAKAEKCLSNAIYFEARDQPYKGQVAVAQVVMNRVFSGVYPRDVCGVIYQNANRHLACQFTFACDGKRKVINERAEWARARRIAKDTLDGTLYVQAVGTATHYHANYVHPNWVREMKKYAREGVHLFYRPIAWGNGADEPRWSRAQKKK